MKSEPTLKIEKSLKTYSPSTMCGIKINKFRGCCTAFEVPVECGSTSSGIIDCVQVCEYFSDIQAVNSCYWHIHKSKGMKVLERDVKCLNEYLPGQKPMRCEHTGCAYLTRHSYGIPEILTICYEIKVTKADFKSKNGHNFVGNLNYYVVPYSLYPEIKQHIPNGIGVILYYDGTQQTNKSDKRIFQFPFFGLRKKRECEFRAMTNEKQKWILMSVLKRVKRSICE